MIMEAQIGEVWAPGPFWFSVQSSSSSPLLKQKVVWLLSFLSRPSLEVDRGGGSGPGLLSFPEAMCPLAQVDSGIEESRCGGLLHYLEIVGLKLCFRSFRI